MFQTKYKQKGKEETSSCIFSQLPETKEIEFAKLVTELQSEVRVCVGLSVCLCVCVCVSVCLEGSIGFSM